MAASKLTAVMIAAAGGVLAAVAFAQTMAEITPYFVGGVSTAQRYGATSSGEFRPAISRWSRDLFIGDCLDIPGSSFIFSQTLPQRVPFLEQCRAGASDVVDAVPTASDAWLVVARTSAGLGDIGAAAAALAKSKRSAPNIEWLASWRSRLVENYFEELSPRLMQDYLSDLEVLAKGRDGLDVLVQRYVRHPDRRAYYQQAVETAEPTQQQRFLNRVRAQLVGQS